MTSPPSICTDHTFDCFERISLVKHSLLSANYQNRWMQVGIRQVINRTLMLIQKPCALVLLERTSDGRDFIAVLHTLLDPLWQEHFETFLRDSAPPPYRAFVKKESSFLYFSYDDLKPFVFPFHSNKSILLFEISSETRGHVPDLPPSFSPIPPDDPDSGLVLKILLGSFDDPSSPDSPAALDAASAATASPFHDTRLRELYVSQNLDAQFSAPKNQWQNGHFIAPSSDAPLPPPMEDADSFFESHYREILSIFDREYQRISDSPLLKPEGQALPDIIFFLKQYSQTEKRYRGPYGNHPEGCYRHSVRTIIPRQKREHLRKAFLMLARSEVDEEHAYLAKDRGKPIDLFFLKKDKDPQKKDANVRGDAFLWQLLVDAEDREANIDLIINEMCAPFGPKARSMSDPVLETGYVQIKQDPFADGGSHRLEQDIVKSIMAHPDMKADALPRDYKRLVYYHYAMSMMAPIPHEGMLSAILVPGHVGGAIWFCTGFLSRPNAQNSQSCWLDNYHFYHSICLYIVRGVRHKVRALYLQHIQKVYISSTRLFAENIAHKKSFKPHALAKVLNPELEKLTRVYPFCKVEFLNVPANDTDSFKEQHIGQFNFFHKFLGVWNYAVVLSENPFFHLDIQGIYLAPTEVQEKLRDADKGLILDVQALRREADINAGLKDA